MWEPVLSGALADAARVAVHDIARSVPLEMGAVAAIEDSALVLAYATSLDGDPAISQRYDEAIGALVERIGRGGSGLALYYGLAGAGCVLAHVASDAEDVLVPIDR